MCRGNMYHWWETRIPSDICAGKHASLGICVRETRIPGKHISLWHRHTFDTSIRLGCFKECLVVKRGPIRFYILYCPTADFFGHLTFWHMVPMFIKILSWFLQHSCDTDSSTLWQNFNTELVMYCIVLYYYYWADSQLMCPGDENVPITQLNAYNNYIVIS